MFQEKIKSSTWKKEKKIYCPQSFITL